VTSGIPWRLPSFPARVFARSYIALKRANAEGVRDGFLGRRSRSAPRPAEALELGERLRVVSCFVADSVALGVVGGAEGLEHPDFGFEAIASATQRLAELIEQSEEEESPAIPRQQPTDDLLRRSRPQGRRRQAARR